jgi:hypothetical protein
MQQLALVDPGELAPEDQPLYQESAVRVASVRALAEPVAPARAGRGIEIEIGAAAAGAGPGQSCLRLWPKAEARRPRPARPLAERCTFGVIFAASARVADDGGAVAIAVAPLAAWTEQWVFRQDRARGVGEPQWRADVIPPALGQPGCDIGYVEVAGFSPGGRQLLVVREFLIGQGSQRHGGKRFEVLGPDGTVEHWASDPQRLGAFSRWASPVWRRTTLSLR